MDLKVVNKTWSKRGRKRSTKEKEFFFIEIVRILLHTRFSLSKLLKLASYFFLPSFVTFHVSPITARILTFDKHQTHRHENNVIVRYGKRYLEFVIVRVTQTRHSVIAASLQPSSSTTSCNASIDDNDGICTTTEETTSSESVCMAREG